MKKISIGRITIQLLWLALIITSFVSERAGYFRTPILLGTVLLGPLYCGWFCIFGTFQDVMSKLGKKVLKKRFRLPKTLHNYLKGFRYVLLVMMFISFLQVFNNYDGRKSMFKVLPKVVEIFKPEKTETIDEKVQNKNYEEQVTKENTSIEDNKTTSENSNDSHKSSNNSDILVWGVVIFYGVLSFFVDRPFCNYLCTEGARYGILGKMRLFSVKRNEESCVGCKKCDKVCPMNIEVSKEKVVQDAQCISCFNCVESCPKKNTLKIGKVF